MENDKPVAVECTNIMRLQDYLLPPDEIIFFDWLVVKQISFKYVQFNYSEKRIEEETHIKRSRQEKIEEKFKQLGFLETEVKLNKRISSHVRYFYLNLITLYREEVLSSVIRRESNYFHEWLEYLYYHASIQNKISNGISPETFKAHRKIIDDLYEILNQTYKRRIEMYNKGDLTEEKPKRGKIAVQIPRNKTLERYLFHMLSTYDSDAIKSAFSAYIDDILTNQIRVKAFMPYFLSPKDPLKPYSVMEKYLDKYIKYYSYTINNTRT